MAVEFWYKINPCESRPYLNILRIKIDNCNPCEVEDSSERKSSAENNVKITNYFLDEFKFGCAKIYFVNIVQTTNIVNTTHRYKFSIGYKKITFSNDYLRRSAS